MEQNKIEGTQRFEKGEGANGVKGLAPEKGGDLNPLTNYAEKTSRGRGQRGNVAGAG